MLGVKPLDFPALPRVPTRFTRNPDETVPDQEARFRAACPEWIQEHYGDDSGPDDFRWGRHRYRIPVEQLRRAFTWEECLKFWYSWCIQSDLGDHIEKEHPLLWKVRNCQWQYGCGTSWNLLVKHLDGLRRLSLDLPGFEVRVTHTRSINTHASSEHVPGLYLDAAFGVLLYYKGKHVLTIGFALGGDSLVTVAQIQLREKKGNRFLYALPSHYVDMSLDLLYRAFGDSLWIVTGESATQAVRRSYGKTPCSMTDEDEGRIQKVYDRPLAGFVRNPSKSRERVGRTYVKLTRQSTQTNAA